MTEDDLHAQVAEFRAENKECWNKIHELEAEINHLRELLGRISGTRIVNNDENNA